MCRLEEFEKKIVLPHEKTLSKAKEDRFKLFKATNSNFSQVFTLYSDPENPLQPEDIEYKFRNVVGACLSKSDIDKAVKLVAGLEKMENINELLALIAAPVITL